MNTISANLADIRQRRSLGAEMSEITNDAEQMRKRLMEMSTRRLTAS